MNSGTLGFSGHHHQCELSPSTNLSAHEGPQVMPSWGCAGGVVQKYGGAGSTMVMVGVDMASLTLQCCTQVGRF